MTYNAAAWLVDRHVESTRGDRLAVICRDQRVTYEALLRQIWRAQHALAGGLAGRDQVGEGRAPHRSGGGAAMRLLTVLLLFTVGVNAQEPFPQRGPLEITVPLSPVSREGKRPSIRIGELLEALLIQQYVDRPSR